MAARRLCAVLPLILAISFLLFGASDCSRPSSPEQRQPRAPTATAPPAVAAETGTQQPVAVETKDDGPPSSLATASPRDKEQGGGGVGSGHGISSALLEPPPPPVLRRSNKLARRFLMSGVVEGADSAARASCRSSDAHIGCAPPAEH
ncbi:uncharacterized protein LOC120648516 [Panicum virgatum]|uniref:Uncharacterized protein n=1 Tax=Panicum virgatum TaxID=38727 RepID=A0A8T0N915_PANVG|nr:uncharacterized protein LOC120648516 [Panicum virgatum]KAG2546361.1 hypothetical protein PVAP13_9KG028500 [Panicum virgatum]